MILGERYPGFALTPAVEADVARIEALWGEARARFGGAGPYLFGAFGAADIMFAPVVTRFVTYDVPLGDVSRAYVDAMTSNAWMMEWAAGAAEEPWVIEKYHPKL
jgi:glutathione S-transferase